MLFNSFTFLFVFLPLTLMATYSFGRYHQSAAKIALTLLSLGFYAWWNPVHLPLLLGSILFNFLMGGLIQRAVEQRRVLAVKAWITVGVLADVALLGWFKYANFVADNANLLLGTHLELHHIALPLAISFFTFQKIAYLVDSARGIARRISFLDFALFAAFFPQLIAGPIVHYAEVVPQLRTRLFGTLIWRNILVGLTIFSIGLFKKTVIADTISGYANTFFASAAQGASFSLVSGWLAAATFTFQLYFDFSGYSDMAIGLGRMLGVKLPLNFHSPLRAPNISEYWRRWHMTLQRFIVAYIFQPLSIPLNRWAASRGLEGWSAFFVAIGIPTFVTFVAVGIWHGAGWTFVLFGVMHATYMCINAAWRVHRRNLSKRRKKRGLAPKDPGTAERIANHLITLAAIAFGNVMFRAGDVAQTLLVWRGMAGLGGSGWDSAEAIAGPGLLLTLIISSTLVFLAPNTQQIMRRFAPAHNAREWADVAQAQFSWTWRPNFFGLMFAATALFLGTMFVQRGQAVFLYFNF
jgi:alginate O-acetyltransferase complex protein AlgI